MTDSDRLGAALAYLDDHVNLEALAAGRFGPPTLDRMVELAALLGDPQRAAPVVHITGTNGKGSTARIVTRLLTASGLAVGTYTSPDLERVNERLALDGEPIGDDDLADAILAVADLERVSGIRPTRFEVVTLAAFRWFADVAVDVMVLEVGMAGTWDATNIADGIVAVVTNVGLDHTAVLGPTRAHIANEKAGIVKPGATLVLGETDPELVPIFEERATESWRRGRDFDCTANALAVGGRALDLRTPGGSYDDVFLALHGAHQGDNAAVAVAAAEAFFARPLDDGLVREGLAEVRVPGRFEVVRRSPLVVLDGAHNPDGARAAASTVADVSSGGGLVLVVGMNADRDAEEMLRALSVHEAELVVACAADWARAMPAAEVAGAATALGARAVVASSVEDAVARALDAADPTDVVLVAGSLYVVGAARRSLSPE